MGSMGKTVADGGPCTDGMGVATDDGGVMAGAVKALGTMGKEANMLEGMVCCDSGSD